LQRRRGGHRCPSAAGPAGFPAAIAHTGLFAYIAPGDVRLCAAGRPGGRNGLAASPGAAKGAADQRDRELLMGLWKNIVALLLLLSSCAALAEKFTIAAASDLRYALNEVIVEYRKQYPNHEPTVIYGSSGKMTTQIVNGAPYDIFFSADIGFPQKLHAEGFAVTEPAVYAIGRVVLWSANHDASQLTLKDLAADTFRRIAIAQPAHAPSGQRDKEAMQDAGVGSG